VLTLEPNGWHGFDADDNEVYLFHGEKDVKKIPKDAKAHLAETLLREVFP
jgi:phosphopantothenoylcysteine synthetase/decarboxylase